MTILRFTCMMIRVNGNETEVPPDATVADLLAQVGLNDRAVAVEVNEQLVPRRRHAEHRLAKGDRVELVTLVGGG